MTPAQRIAFQHRTRLPEQCVHPRFASWRGKLSLRLTLDAGYA